MVAKRIMPCLDVREGRTVKGVRFQNLVDLGDPAELGEYYSLNGADELVLLDITATVEKRNTFIETVKRVSAKVSIPFTVGGGVRTLRDIEDLLEAGADKVSINSAAVKTPSLIDEAATQFGNQCLVVAVDSKEESAGSRVYVESGQRKTHLNTEAWVLEVQARGAGEVLLTSMDRDGTQSGFALTLLSKIGEKLSIPLIASGGAGRPRDFVEVLSIDGVDAALAAGMLHRGECTVMEIKRTLQGEGIEVRYESQF